MVMELVEIAALTFFKIWLERIISHSSHQNHKLFIKSKISKTQKNKFYFKDKNKYFNV